MALRDSIIQLDSYGLTDILLPFALIFVIVYAVSKAVPYLKSDDHKNFRVVIALVVSLLTVIPHVTNSYPSGLDVVSVINQSIPSVVLVIVAVALILMLIGVSGNNPASLGWLTAAKWISVIIVILIFLDNINFGFGTGYFGNYSLLSWFSDPDMQALLLVILVFGLIVWFVTSSGKKQWYDKKEKNTISDSAYNRLTTDQKKEYDPI